MKAALRSAGVLGTDESPARLGADDRREAPNPHVFTVRTMNAYTHLGAGAGPPDLIWCGAGPDRTSATIDSFAVLPGYRGVLVRDDYGGYLKYDSDLSGVQQCVAHLRRYLTDAFNLGADQQAWTMQADRALAEAMHLVNTARRDGLAAPHAPLAARLARLRTEYDWATALGRSVNINATWPRGKGNHPAKVLAARLEAKAEQVWLFTTRFDVPATNNGSESAIRGVKLTQKISGIWRTLPTLRASMRLRSYLATTASHGLPGIQAMRRALAGDPWMPPALTA